MKFYPTHPLPRETGLALLIAAMLAGTALAYPHTAALSTLAALLDDTAILILLACGQMTVLLTRGVDLSVAANVALTGMASALFNRHWPQFGVFPVLLASPVLGALLGAVNGLLVWRLRVAPIVATLGTLAIYRGLVFVLSEGAWINSNQMSAAFLDFPRGSLLGLTVLSWLALGCAMGVAWWLYHSERGRNIRAAGDNPDAALYAGIEVGRSQFHAFVVSGALAGLCGYLWVARFGVAYTDVAQGFELQVIAACVIGGVSINGGVGTVAGVLLGCLFLGVLKNALPLLGLSPFWQMAVSGLALTVAVVVNARASTPGKRSFIQAPARGSVQ
jgi:rhamnose transport system permease protein